MSGEIPILFDYDFNAYRAKYGESGNFEFVIPCEGTVVFPYVTSLVKNAPDRAKADKVLDYFLSDKGQAMWANAYLRPARPIELPEAIKSKFLPATDYARAKSVDWAKMESVQNAQQPCLRSAAAHDQEGLCRFLLRAAGRLGRGVLCVADGPSHTHWSER